VAGFEPHARSVTMILDRSLRWTNEGGSKFHVIDVFTGTRGAHVADPAGVEPDVL